MRLAAAMPMISACVRMTSIQYCVEDERRDDRQHEAADADHPLGDELLLVHENLPKRPCGRKASTSASSMKVNTIEYWVQQLLPAVGRYTAENENTSP